MYNPDTHVASPYGYHPSHPAAYFPSSSASSYPYPSYPPSSSPSSSSLYPSAVPSLFASPSAARPPKLPASTLQAMADASLLTGAVLSATEKAKRAAAAKGKAKRVRSNDVEDEERGGGAAAGKKKPAGSKQGNPDANGSEPGAASSSSKKGAEGDESDSDGSVFSASSHWSGDSEAPGSSSAPPGPVETPVLSKAALKLAFDELFSTMLFAPLPAYTTKSFQAAHRAIFRKNLGFPVGHADALLLLLLQRAGQLFKELDKDEHRIEREMLLALFAGVIGKSLGQKLFDATGWLIGRLMTHTKDGEDVAKLIKEGRRRRLSKGGSGSAPQSVTVAVGGAVAGDADGHPESSVSAQGSSVRPRTRICKTTGRTMQEERDIALKYFALPQFAQADVMTVYLQYKFDTTGGDNTKRPPLSRAHFYAVAPADRKRKAKPEVVQVNCEHCHKPLKFKVEEIEEPGALKPKRKKPKKTKKDEGKEEHKGQGAVEAKDEQEGKQEEGKEAKDAAAAASTSDGKEDEQEEDDVELVRGPPRKRLKLELVKPTPKPPAPTVSRSAAPGHAPVRVRRTPEEIEAAKTAQAGREPRKRGRPKKVRPQLTLTKELLPLLQPFVAAHQQAPGEQPAPGQSSAEQPATAASRSSSAAAPAAASQAPTLPKL